VYCDYSAPLRRPRRRRRRRDPRVVVVSLVGSLLALVVLTGSAYGSSPASSRTVLVQPGDTIWNIAAGHYPGEDIRERVAEIEAVNHLPGAFVVAGQDLALPPD